MTPVGTPAGARSRDVGDRVSEQPRTGSEADRSTPSGRPPSPRQMVRLLRLRVLHGDRPYYVAFLAAIGVSLVIVSGPIQTWLGQRDLVEQRAAVLTVLEDENTRLADRAADLNDPDTIEAEAREELGMVRPGEVPYVIVPPRIDSEQIAPDLTDVETADQGWFSSVWEAITGLFG